MHNKIIWNENYNTGIEEIDTQHQHIISAVCKLCCAVSKNENKNEIKKALKELDFYFENHFATEENYMQLYNYKNILEHREAHNYFKKTYEQIRYSYFYVDNKNLPKDEIINTYALHLCMVLKDWLELHLPTLDKEFANFIRDKL